MSWREHFRGAELMTNEEVRRRFPNAHRQLDENAFISHAGNDTAWIRKNITPCLRKIYVGKLGDPIFIHSSKSGGADGYKHLVLLALTKSAFGILIVSAHSANHPWVVAEVDWLIEHHRPLAICRLDSTSPAEIDLRLAAASGGLKLTDFAVFNFATNISPAQTALERWVVSAVPWWCTKNS